jgi:hypothetical protein
MLAEIEEKLIDFIEKTKVRLDAGSLFQTALQIAEETSLSRECSEKDIKALISCVGLLVAEQVAADFVVKYMMRRPKKS